LHIAVGYSSSSVPVTPPQRGVMQSDGLRDNGVLECVGPALWKEQPPTEQAPLVADDGVQRAAGVVHNVQQFVQSPCLCPRHQRVQLHADHRAGSPDQFIQPGCVLWCQQNRKGAPTSTEVKGSDYEWSRGRVALMNELHLNPPLCRQKNLIPSCSGSAAQDHQAGSLLTRMHQQNDSWCMERLLLPIMKRRRVSFPMLSLCVMSSAHVAWDGGVSSDPAGFQSYFFYDHWPLKRFFPSYVCAFIFTPNLKCCENEYP